ncbi:hypothetical protein [Ramlibacter sp. AN1133]|uniref:hypothetical protein n=1 Tax=Ramlibacter sp. AN1133 TaxID=3133429 RepID=UPI0030BE7117
MKQEPRPVAGCILFLRLRGTDAAPPAGEQALRAALEAAAAAWDRKLRVVLQAPEGFALAGPVVPSVALAAARRAAAHTPAGAVSMALHHGPLRALAQAPGGPRLAGEGLTTAAVVAGLAGGRTVLSAAFRDALRQEAPDLADDVEPITDVAGPGGAALFRDDPAGARRRGQRRTLLAAGGMAALLAAGWAGREARQHYEAAHRPAVIVLDIRPSGEVFIDGVAQGASPPLTRVSVAPGAHTIEVRNTRARPLRLQVDLQPGQELAVKHVFPPPPAPRRPAPPKAKPRPEPGPLDRFKFW